MTDILRDHDALGLAALIRQGELRAAEVLEATIERIERYNPRINAVIQPLYEAARASLERVPPHSPFAGVPFLLKDLIAEYGGTPLCEGSRALQGYVSPRDSVLVERFKAAGVVIVGKTNTPEFGSLPTTEPVLFGATANPWDITRTPGGSSGGSAAAVAAGLVPMAHANDGGGSIRIPASCCGVFGLKPSRARNPLGPYFGDMLSGLICEHAVTRTVRDSAALLDATCGADLGDPYSVAAPERPFLEEVGRDPGCLTIGVLAGVPEGWGEEGTTVHADCHQAVQEAARLCASLGHRLVEVSPESVRCPDLFRSFGTLWTCGIGHTIAYWERVLGQSIGEEQLEPTTWQAYQAGLKRSGREYLLAVEHLQRFTRQMAQCYQREGYDVLLSPTISQPPVPLGAFTPSPTAPRQWATLARAFGAFTAVYNATGQPAMSVPLSWNTAGLPIGVQFAGRCGDEATLFRLAGQLEQACPWRHRTPPFAAEA